MYIILLQWEKQDYLNLSRIRNLNEKKTKTRNPTNKREKHELNQLLPAKEEKESRSQFQN